MSRAEPGKYEGLPGNSRLITVTDISAVRAFGTIYRARVRFNRPLVFATNNMGIWVVEQETVELVAGSAKMGIELMHPRRRLHMSLGLALNQEGPTVFQTSLYNSSTAPWPRVVVAAAYWLGQLQVPVSPVLNWPFPENGGLEPL